MNTRHDQSIPISRITAVVLLFLIVAGCATISTQDSTEPAASQNETSVAAADSEQAESPASTGDKSQQTNSDMGNAAADSATPNRAAVAPANDNKAATEPTTAATAKIEPSYLLVRVERMLPSGVIDSVREIVRDQTTGRAVTETVGVPDARARKRIEYAYPEIGVVRITRFGEDGTVESSTIRSYDGEMLLSEVQLDSQGAVALESSYRYEGGRIATWSLTNADGELLSTSQYRYDGPRLTRIDNLDGDGVLQEYSVSEYDDQGRRVSEKLFDAKNRKTLSVTTYVYEEPKGPSMVRETGLGINREVRYEYDTHGNVTSEAIYGPGNRMLYVNRYTYEPFPSNEARKP